MNWGEKVSNYRSHHANSSRYGGKSSRENTGNRKQLLKDWKMGFTPRGGRGGARGGRGGGGGGGGASRGRGGGRGKIYYDTRFNPAIVLLHDCGLSALVDHLDCLNTLL